MTSANRKRIQAVLAIAIAIAAVRTGIILYHRGHGAQAASRPVERPLDPDYYVSLKKLHAYDLKSLREGVAGHTVWAREGYRYVYYAFDPQRRRTDFTREAGTLGTIERLEVTDVVADRSPAPGQRQIMVVFSKDGRSYAVPVGAARGENYQIYADEVFFYDDPHQLYRHWPRPVWEAIERNEIMPGMNELQASFAAGVGVPEQSSDPAEKVVRYPRGGKPLTVIYRNGKAVSINQG